MPGKSGGGHVDLDTAAGNGEGRSESRVGQVLRTRRDEVLVATKIPPRARSRDSALREVEASLKRLQTDHVEVLHLHSLGDEADLAPIAAKDGALEAPRDRLAGWRVALERYFLHHHDGMPV